MGRFTSASMQIIVTNSSVTYFLFLVYLLDTGTCNFVRIGASTSLITLRKGHGEIDRYIQYLKKNSLCEKSLLNS